MIRRRRGRRAVGAMHASSVSPRLPRSARGIRLVMPNYTVKEIFYTLQGEGFHSGRAAVFCRFAGCNLWTGREADRATAICSFCDTDFVGRGPDGGSFASADELADAVAS